MGTLLIAIFILGYAAIALEHFIHVNKAASALITAVALWAVFMLAGPSGAQVVTAQLVASVGNFSGILFFLMAAMTIVRLIDAHNGFEVITLRITTTSKRKLLWIIVILAFFLSAILDNLTTTIVMTSLTLKLITDKKDSLLFIGMIVIAANAGGAWSPIGDVTTTMLWIGGQISAWRIVGKLLLPSLVSCVVPLLFASMSLKGNVRQESSAAATASVVNATERNIVFVIGMLSLLFVPVFKSLTHLPPYMGILLGLGVLWAVTERMHATKNDHERDAYSVAGALQRIDLPSILFFLGILASISALESAHVLSDWAHGLDRAIHNETIVVLIIGLLSAIVDNVPLVAGAMGMYNLAQFPMDHHFWIFLSYCAGTGGSALIIGSAAGVAAMGMAKIDFFWYLKKISWLAIMGYVAGAACYLLMR